MGNRKTISHAKAQSRQAAKRNGFVLLGSVLCAFAALREIVFLSVARGSADPDAMTCKEFRAEAQRTQRKNGFSVLGVVPLRSLCLCVKPFSPLSHER
jgi:hypothetical protein